ncbi:hypothetical protein FCV25MIE_34957, partial [Fagus crenata]
FLHIEESYYTCIAVVSLVWPASIFCFSPIQVQLQFHCDTDKRNTTKVPIFNNK